MDELSPTYPIYTAPDELGQRLVGAAVDLGTALGMIRVLTLLPLFDPALTEVEALMARSWESLREARLLLEEQRVGAEGAPSE